MTAVVTGDREEGKERLSESGGDGLRPLGIWGGQGWGQVGQIRKGQKLFTFLTSLLKAEPVLIPNEL